MEYFDFFFIRTPFYSIAQLRELSSKILDKNSLAEEMLSVFNESHFKEAIYLSSDTLFKELDKDNGKNDEKIYTSLFKYFNRACTRSTPFGLFSKVGHGIFDDGHYININHEKFTKFKKIDMIYGYKISKVLEKEDSFFSKILFYTNDSIYRRQNKILYIFCEIVNEERKFYLKSIDGNYIIDGIIDKGVRGIKYQDVKELVISAGGNEKMAKKYFKQLIDLQIIVSEFEPNTTGTEYFKRLIERFTELNFKSKYVKIISKINDYLEKANSINDYKNIEKYIFDSFSGKIEVQSAFLNIDCFLEGKNSINKKIVNELKKDVKQILKLGSALENTSLKSFKDRFYERYEFQMVSLVDALDINIGIGYGEVDISQDNTDLMAGISLNQTDKQHKSISWNDFDKLKLKKYTESLINNQYHINIADEDINKLNIEDYIDKLPETFYVFGNIITGYNDKYSIYLSDVSGSTGANLLTRFGLNNTEIKNRLAEIVNFEENTNASCIYAEIVHFPAEKVANILQRPQLRKHEIPFLSNSTINPSDKVNLKDLFIGLDHDYNLYLYSIKHKKRVIPRLTSAYNYDLGLGLYKFLCDLQTQNSGWTYYWDWGVLSQNIFLPRVMYKNNILSRAQWNIVKDNHDFLKKEINDFTIDKIIQEIKIPLIFSIIDRDNEILIDLNTYIGKKIFIEEIRKHQHLKLSEYLYIDDYVANNHQITTNEFIIPFKNINSYKYDHQVLPPIPPNTNNNRKYILGDKWLYLKIYLKDYYSDDFLCKYLSPLFNDQKSKIKLKKWFFVRFNDPDSHLRIRFNILENSTGFYDKIKKIFTEYLQDGIIHKIQVDTYVQELERYGVNNIENLEEFFYYDSITNINIIQFIKKNGMDESFRWRVGFKYIDSFLNELNYNTHQKKLLFQELGNAYMIEFNIDKGNKKELNNRYRKESSNISNFMKEDSEIDSIIFDFQNKRVKLFRKIQTQSLKDGLSFNDILFSIIHMTLNRLFNSNQRQRELVLYNFFYRYYDTQYALEKTISHQ